MAPPAVTPTKSSCLGDHRIDEVLDLRPGVPGFLSVWLRNRDAPAEIESFTQVLVWRTASLASLCKPNVVSHARFLNLSAILLLRPLGPNLTLTALS